MNKIIKESLNTKNILHILYKTFLVLLGTFILAYGTAVFLVPFNIINGGVDGVGLLFQEAGILTVDIWSYIICWGLFAIGIFVLGVKFSIGTLISTIFYPMFLSIILRTGMALPVVERLAGPDASVVINEVLGIIQVVDVSSVDTGRLLLSGLFGGILSGIGCAVTFIGGGSTGGFDIISFIVKKYLGIEISVTGFIMDAIIVSAGLIVDLVGDKSQSYSTFAAGLIGILSAMMCAASIELIYSGFTTNYVCDVVTDNPLEVTDFIHKELDRTTTIFDVTGGYTKEGKTMVRIVIPKREYMAVKDALARIDSRAFIIFYEAKMVAGEGFAKNQVSTDTTASKAIQQIKDMKDDGVVEENKEDGK